MSSNAPGPTFDPDKPREALGMLDALLSLDSMNFNRATHNAIQRAVTTLGGIMDQLGVMAGQIETQKESIEMLTRELSAAQARPLSLVGSPPAAEERETESTAQSAS